MKGGYHLCSEQFGKLHVILKSPKALYVALWRRGFARASIKDTISNAVASIRTFFTETIPNAGRTAVKWFQSIPDQMRDVGRNLLMGLWNGISDKIAWLKSKVTGVVDTIQSWFTGKRGFDEHSPSKWANGVAKYVMQGMADGFENGLPSLMDSVGGVTDRIKNGLGFDTARIDYATSATSRLARAVNRSKGDEMRPIVIDFTAQLDGKTLVRQINKKLILFFLLVFSAGGRYNTDTGLPVVVGGYGSLCLALVGGGTESFSFPPYMLAL